MTELLSATTPLTVLSAADIGSWIRLAAQAVTDHTEELTKLDAAIGDADHGTNMRRGLAAVVTALDEGEPDTPAAVLKKVAMTLVSQVTVAAAIHDLNIAALYCDRLIAIKQGRVVGLGTPAQLLTEEFIHDLYEVHSKVERDDSGRIYIRYLPQYGVT